MLVASQTIENISAGIRGVRSMQRQFMDDFCKQLGDYCQQEKEKNDNETPTGEEQTAPKEVKHDASATAGETEEEFVNVQPPLEGTSSSGIDESGSDTLSASFLTLSTSSNALEAMDCSDNDTKVDNTGQLSKSAADVSSEAAAKFENKSRWLPFSLWSRHSH